MATISLLEIAIALAALAVAGSLAVYFDQSVIPLYIVAGILVGPNWPTAVAGIPLTLVDHGEFVDALAELGIVFLLFFLGLEFNLEQLVSGWNRLVGIGTVDFLINFTIGVGLGLLFGFGPLEILFLAGIVYISSSAVITKSLIERGWTANPEGGAILGTLVFEDILIAVYLALLTAIALGGGEPADAATSIALAVGFLIALGLFAWYGTGLLERVIAIDSDELFLLRVLAVTTLVAGTALEMGVSEAVAAFFVGTAFSRTPYIERLEHVVGPAKDLFAAIFFLSIGLTTDVTLLGDVALLLGAAIVVTTLGKLASGFVGGMMYGLDRRRSLRVGVGLIPRGEFSLVLAALAGSVGTGALAELIPAFTVGYVLVMSILGTVAIQVADRETAFPGFTS